MTPELANINTWVFDLDNTLYDAESYIFGEVGRRMTEFVADFLKVPHDQADAMREKYYLEYGTTLRGLMTDHGLAPEVFLSYVHDIDLAHVPQCAVTQEYLGLLPGRRIVFTNAPKRFAIDMTERLGIAHHFEDIFAIEDADYWPKPDMRTYRVFVEKYGFDPARACMFEDMAVNLEPAHDLGMTTVWLHGSKDVAQAKHLHYQARKLPDWLTTHIQKQ